MSEQTPINKQDFLSLAINELATNPSLREQLCEKLLLGLHNNGVENQQEDNSMISISDSSSPTTSEFIREIFDSIDWQELVNNVYGEDTFFNGNKGLYTSLGEALYEDFIQRNDYKAVDIDEKNWSNHYWNDSLARLMQLLYQHIDPAGIQAYENSGLLIELIDDDGKIDTEHLRASIAPDGGETKLAALRVIDIINADAGNSFEPMTELYWYGFFYETATVKYGTQTVQLTNVLYVEKADRILAALENGDEVSPSDLEKIFKTVNNNGYIYSGQVSEYVLPSTTISATITGTKKKFKIVKEPWVVPWYNIDGDTYRRVRGEDMKVSVMTDPNKLGFTQAEDGNWIRLLMPQYKRRVEVEDLNRNFWVIGQVIAGISIYLFDEGSPIMKMLKGLIEEIGQLWENMIYLWTALSLLSQKKFYDTTHSEVVMLSLDSLVPYERFDNFDVAATVESIKQHLNYLVQMYPEENLAILPFIRDNNYEHNYYGAVWYPGIFIYNRNVASPEWSLIGFYSTSPNPYFTTTGFYIALGDFADSIYGIHENEETYDYIIPLSNTDEIIAENDIRYYGLARDFITFDASVAESINSINVSIKLTDLGKALIDNSQESIIFNYEAHYNQGIMVLDNFAFNNDGIESEDGGTIKIKKGYYQGELLSTCEDVDRVIYDICVLPTVKLKPTVDTYETIVENYKNPQYEQMRAEDSAVLEKIISNYYEYNVNGVDSFWTAEREECYTVPEYFWAIDANNNTDIISTRDAAKINLDPNSELKYPTITDWKTDNQNYYRAGRQQNLDCTIIFVEGNRDTNYVSYTSASAESKTYFPYGEDTDGLLMPYVKNANIQTAATGAKISLPLKEGRSFGFYDNHTSISSGGPTFPLLNNYVPYEDHMYWTTGKVSRILDTEIANYNIADVHVASSHGAGGQEQWLVSILEGSREINNDNWLVTKVAYGETDYISLGAENSGVITFNNLEKYCVQTSSMGNTAYCMQIARLVGRDICNNLPASDQLVGTIAQGIQQFFEQHDITLVPYDNLPMQQWYYQQAVLSGKCDQWYEQQCKFYALASAAWNDKLDETLDDRSIESIEFSSYGLVDTEGNTYTNRRYLYTRMRADVAVYVFGPNGIYSRRVYGRDATGRYTNEYMRDEETANGNVDRLRESYVVISNNKPQENYEKYKSKGHLVMADGGGYYQPSDDDDYFNDYNIMWQDTGVIPPWDIPR